ncbi:cysteine proteinase inhibitor 1-like [Solanum dulcamara]|uniref:cysteine proteinase inhibitor 1-like n=1 Tax=Solanum dulcamara TaxID=45834 RepID=UPI0024853775|nr:cysteine proteinase inhibitor 1-like [Solanum dulcamara]
MSIKFNPILGTLLVLVSTVLLHVSEALGGRKEVNGDDWDTIPDLQDLKVVEIGKFAIDEHNKEAKTKLEFQNLDWGLRKVDKEIINYRLVIMAKDVDKPHYYK